jgi:cellulose synthase/poly-beta-1,6-N-acetylglucosamine synthase-like glycosyltransferase
MMEYIDKFVEFWSLQGFVGILSIFWYFFFLEVPRYLMFDVIIIALVKHRKGSRKYKEAHEDLRIKLFSEKPRISIIVPGKNEGEHIYELIQSLKAQTYTNFELIIIDDGSTDDSYEICTNLYKLGLIDIYLRNNERGGKASAANLGLRYATGKYIIHLDADSSLDPNAVEEIILPFLADPNIGAVGGNVKVRNRVNLLTNCEAMEYITSVSLGRMVTSHLGIYKIISGAFGAFRKDLLDLLGGWDIGPGLDGDITMKIRKMRYEINFAEKAICLTNVPSKVSTLTKQRLRWGKSIVRFRLRKHKDIFVPDKHFNLLNFISSFENVFFSIVMDFLWIYYIITLVMDFYNSYWYILVFKVLMYSCFTAIQLALYLVVTERRTWELRLFKYVPLMWFYTGYYMRFVRTYAYIIEFFGYSSYKDKWNPEKTSKIAKSYGL